MLSADLPTPSTAISVSFAAGDFGPKTFNLPLKTTSSPQTPISVKYRLLDTFGMESDYIPFPFPSPFSSLILFVGNTVGAYSQRVSSSDDYSRFAVNSHPSDYSVSYWCNNAPSQPSLSITTTIANPPAGPAEPGMQSIRVCCNKEGDGEKESEGKGEKQTNACTV